MAVKRCRVRKYFVQMMVTCLALSLMMMYWQQLDIGHVLSHSYRYLLANHFTTINKSLTISREQARRFSNFGYLINHPDKCRDQDVLLLVFVKTTPQNLERRNAIRSTWGQETYTHSHLGVTVKVLFALGAIQTNSEEPAWSKRNNFSSQERLIQEDRLHSDLIQQDFLDSFHNLTLKLIMQFHWKHNYCAHARFFMTTDDDVFVHMPNLVRYLQELSSRGVTDFWVGRVHKAVLPIRTKSSKYYVPYEMYKWLFYPAYTAGAGYVVSGDTADKIYHATLTLNASLYIDDVFMGLCANAVGVLPREHVYFSWLGKAPFHHCIFNQMMTSHGHGEDIYELWYAATHPRVRWHTSGLLGKLYCTAVKVALLCRPYRLVTYPCKAAFL